MFENGTVVAGNEAIHGQLVKMLAKPMPNA
jgi:hypothetical protein